MLKALMNVKRPLRVVILASALTLTTGALAYRGSGVALGLARILGIPAIAFSNIVNRIGAVAFVNGLLADPGGTFCFATIQDRVLSHLRSASMAYLLFFGILEGASAGFTALRKEAA